METNEQQTIRQTQGRLLGAIDFHEQRIVGLRKRLEGLRKRCEHPRLVGEVVLCPDCGFERKAKKGKVAA